MTQQEQQDSHRKTVGEWLSLPFEWRIPVYQRHYAWKTTKDESGPIHLFWETVKDQAVARLEGETPKQHYLGVVLVDDKTDRSKPADGITRYDVVDGQQRLTTIQIALLALAKVARDKYRLENEFWEQLEGYVFHKGHPRLLLTNFDKKQFRTVVHEASDMFLSAVPGEEHVLSENAKKSKIMANCRFFEEAIKKLVAKHAPKEAREVLGAILNSILQGFDLVLIVLREEDNAQLIFQSLNSYAEPLSTFDLIRNNVFLRAAKQPEQPELDVQLFNSPAWQCLEDKYWEEKAGTRAGGRVHIEAYVARMLVAEMKKTVGFNRNDIFKAYQDFVKDRNFPSMHDEVKALGKYANDYCHLDNKPQEEVPRFPEASRLSKVDCGLFYHTAWKSRDFYPVIFCIAGSDASNEDKARMIKLLESYVIRRGVCGLLIDAYNKYAVTICDGFKDGVNYANLRKVLEKTDADTEIFPDDERVMGACVTTEFYGTPFQNYVFEKLEHHFAQDKKERGIIEGLTVDHILPQKWHTVDEWEEMLKGEDRDTIRRYINTIGNLTPMSRQRNSRKSNRPWSEVKDLLHQSPMTLNRVLANHDSWGVKQITERSRELARAICEIWPYDIS